ncbi:MAG: hypothetical protein F4X59_13775 [Holophagales bacterium]|nr:hypothetical protein [Holophagales bacterium]MYC11183.1 hypothetical protein [Holophagales bacterium]
MADYIDFPSKLRSSRRDHKLVDASAIDGVLPGSQVGTEGIEHEIEELQARTRDLHSGAGHSGWAAVNADGSEGGIAVVAGAPSLAKARAVSTWAAELDSGLSGRALILRLPHGADIAHYRAELDANDGDSYLDLLSRYTLLGSDSGGASWDYYGFDIPLGSTVASVTLEITGTTAAAGSSTFSGNLALAKILAALGVESVADLGGGASPLIENAFDGTTGTGTGEAQVSGVAVENSANVLYLIRVRATTEYVTGAALYQLRSGSPLEIGIANFYSKGGADAGKLYRTLDEATDDALEIWQVNDQAAIRAAINAGGKTDEQIGVAAFTHPPPALGSSQRRAVRDAIDAAQVVGGEVFDDGALRWIVLAQTQDLDGVATNAIRFSVSLEGVALGMGAAVDDQSVTIPAELPQGAIGWHLTLLNGSDILDNTPILNGLGTYIVRSDAGGNDRGLAVTLEDQSGLQFRVNGRINALQPGDVLQIRVAYFDADAAELRDDLAKLHTYIAEHVTDVSDEVRDPTQADSPAHYYLTRKARHTVRGVSVPWESGLYELTTGTANAVQFKGGRVGTGTGQRHGFIARGLGGFPDLGRIVHNPLSAIAGFYQYAFPTGNNDIILACYLKTAVYDVLREQHNLANTAIFMKVTDGTTTKIFEMGNTGDRHYIGGVDYNLMQANLTVQGQVNDFSGFFASANSFAPTLTVTFNQGSAQAGRSDSPLSYLGTTATTKAYTFRSDDFALITGLGDEYVESDDVRHIVGIGEAAYNALAIKDPNTFYLRTGP